MSLDFPGCLTARLQRSILNCIGHDLLLLDQGFRLGLHKKLLVVVQEPTAVWLRRNKRSGNASSSSLQKLP